MSAIKHRPIDTLALLLVFGFLCFLFAKTIFVTYQICWEDDDYSHGLLLPFLTIYFLWTERKLLGARVQKVLAQQGPSTFSYSGLLLLVLGMMIFSLGYISDLLYFRWLAFFLSLVGFAYLSFGSALANIFLPPIILNFMAKPIPDSLIPRLFGPLQTIAAQVSATVLEWLRVPVFLSGNIIEIPGMQLMVEEACSGLRSMMALLTVSLIVLISVRMPIIAKILVVLFSIFTAIVLNIIRVAATGVMAHFISPESASGFFHTFSGMVIFIVGLVIVYAFGMALEKMFSSPREARS